MHTPGPWYAVCEDTINGEPAKFSVDAGGGCVALVNTIGPADARLIAAAPAMLQALLDALPYVEDVLSDPAALACFKPGTVQRHAQAIRDAISFATEG